MPRKKRTFDNPLEAGRYFLKLKVQKGMSVEQIAAVCDKSVPAVYKYIALAESPESVQTAIDQGLIPATKVIRIMDKSKDTKQSLSALVDEAIEQRQENNSIMKSQGVSKLTVKSRLQAFRKELEGTKTKNAKLLLNFAEALNSGAPVSELIALAQAQR